jgi:hypothetical protein
MDRANELRSQRRERQIVESACWLLLKNRDWLRPDEDVEFEGLLAATHGPVRRVCAA